MSTERRCNRCRIEARTLAPVRALARRLMPRLQKAVAGCVLACFTVSFVAGQSLLAMATATREAADLDRPVDAFILPSTWGKITDARYFGGGDVVIAVQDLHCHPEVQKNISSILGFLDKKYGIRNIYLEGASGKVDTSWMLGIADRALRQKVVDSLMSRGELTGVEYYSVLSQKTDIVRGLEDEELYEGNILRLNALLEKQGEIDAAYEGLAAGLRSLEKEYLGNANRKLERAVRRYNRGRLSTKKYYALLRKYARRQGIDVYSYRNMMAYLDLVDQEKRLEYAKIARELGQCIGVLKTVLPYRAYQRLLERTREFSQLDELYVLLPQLTKEFNVTDRVEKEFPHLSALFKYISATHKLNPLTLVGEEKKLVREIRQGLSTSESEREVVFLGDFLGILKAYLGNKASADDYAYFAEHKDAFVKLWTKYAGTGDMEKLEPYFDMCDEYYRVNEQRNCSFIRNLQVSCAQKGAPADADDAFQGDDIAKTAGALSAAGNVSVTVTGGFHTQGFTELLRKNRINYLVVTPNVTQDTALSDRVYKNLIEEQGEILTQALPPAAVSCMPFTVRAERIVVPIVNEMIGTRRAAKAGIRLQEIDAAVNGILESCRERTKESDAVAFRMERIGADGDYEFSLNAPGKTMRFYFSAGENRARPVTLSRNGRTVKGLPEQRQNYRVRETSKEDKDAAATRDASHRDRTAPGADGDAAAVPGNFVSSAAEQALGKGLRTVIRHALEVINKEKEGAKKGEGVMRASWELLNRVLGWEFVSVADRYFRLLAGVEGEMLSPLGEAGQDYEKYRSAISGYLAEAGYPCSPGDIKLSMQATELLLHNREAYGLGTMGISPLTKRPTFIIHEAFLDALEMRGPPDGLTVNELLELLVEYEVYQYAALNHPESNVARAFARYLAQWKDSELGEINADNYHRYIAHLSALSPVELRKCTSEERDIARQARLTEFTDELVLTDQILRYYREQYPGKDAAVIKKAIGIAADRYRNKALGSGESCFGHCLEVARNVAKWGGDDVTVVAALYHEMNVRDLNAVLPSKGAKSREARGARTRAMIEKLAGNRERLYVDGARILYLKNEYALQNYMNMIIKSADDEENMLLLLADKLQTLRKKSTADGGNILVAQELLHIYAPLAMRFGSYEIADDLRDGALLLSDPDEYRKVKSEVEEMLGMSYEEAERHLGKLKAEIVNDLKAKGVRSPQVKIRVKCPYSIWEKLHSDRNKPDHLKNGEGTGEQPSIYDLSDVLGVHIVTGQQYQNDAFGCVNEWVVHRHKALPDDREKGLKYGVPVFTDEKDKGFNRVKYNFRDTAGRIYEVCLYAERDYAKAQSGYIDETALKSPMPHWIYKIGTPSMVANGLFVRKVQFNYPSALEKGKFSWQINQSFASDGLAFTGDRKHDYAALYRSLKDRIYVICIDEDRRLMSVADLPEGSVAEDAVAHVGIDRYNAQYRGVERIGGKVYGGKRGKAKESNALENGEMLLLKKTGPAADLPNFSVVGRAATDRAKLIASGIIVYGGEDSSGKPAIDRKLLAKGEKIVKSRFGKNFPEDVVQKRLRDFASFKGLKDVTELYLALGADIIEKDELFDYMNRGTKRVIRITAGDQVGVLNGITAVIAERQFNIVDIRTDSIGDGRKAIKIVIAETNGTSPVSNQTLKLDFRQIAGVHEANVQYVSELFESVQSMGKRVLSLLRRMHAIEPLAELSCAAAQYLLLQAYEKAIVREEDMPEDWQDLLRTLRSDAAAMCGRDTAKIMVRVSENPELVSDDGWSLASMTENKEDGSITLYLHAAFLQELRGSALPVQMRLLRSLARHELGEYRALNFPETPEGRAFTAYLMRVPGLTRAQALDARYRTCEEYHAYLEYLAAARQETGIEQALAEGQEELFRFAEAVAGRMAAKMLEERSQRQPSRRTSPRASSGILKVPAGRITATAAGCADPRRQLTGELPAQLAAEAYEAPRGWMERECSVLFGKTLVHYYRDIDAQAVRELAAFNEIGTNNIAVLPRVPEEGFRSIGRMTIERGDGRQIEATWGIIVDGDNGRVAAICADGLQPEDAVAVVRRLNEMPQKHRYMSTHLELPFAAIDAKVIVINGAPGIRRIPQEEETPGDIAFSDEGTLRRCALVYRPCPGMGTAEIAADAEMRRLAPFLDAVAPARAFPRAVDGNYAREMLLDLYQPAAIRKQAASVTRAAGNVGSYVMVSATVGNDYREDCGIGELEYLPLYWEEKLSKAGENAMQLLPLTPPAADSPFEPVDAFAGDYGLITLRSIEEVRQLAPDRDALVAPEEERNYVNRAGVNRRKFAVLNEARKALLSSKNPDRVRRYRDYVQREGGWLEAYAERMAAARIAATAPLRMTDREVEEIRAKQGALLDEYAETFKYAQWIFDGQLRAAVQRIHDKEGKVYFWADIDAKNTGQRMAALAHWFGYGFDGVEINLRDGKLAERDTLQQLRKTINRCKPDAFVVVRLPGNADAAAADALRDSYDYLTIVKYSDVARGRKVSGNDVIEMDRVAGGGERLSGRKRIERYRECINKVREAGGILFRMGDLWGDEYAVAPDSAGRWNYRIPFDGEVGGQRERIDPAEWAKALGRLSMSNRRSFYERGRDMAFEMFKEVTTGAEERAVLKRDAVIEMNDRDGAKVIETRGFGLHCADDAWRQVRMDRTAGDRLLRAVAFAEENPVFALLEARLQRLAETDGEHQKFWRAALMQARQLEDRRRNSPDGETKMRSVVESFGFARGMMERLVENNDRLINGLPAGSSDKAVRRALLLAADAAVDVVQDADGRILAVKGKPGSAITGREGLVERIRLMLSLNRFPEAEFLFREFHDRFLLAYANGAGAKTYAATRSVMEFVELLQVFTMKSGRPELRSSLAPLIGSAMAACPRGRDGLVTAEGKASIELQALYYNAAKILAAGGGAAGARWEALAGEMKRRMRDSYPAGLADGANVTAGWLYAVGLSAVTGDDHSGDLVDLKGKEKILALVEERLAGPGGVKETPGAAYYDPALVGIRANALKTVRREQSLRKRQGIEDEGFMTKETASEMAGIVNPLLDQLLKTGSVTAGVPGEFRDRISETASIAELLRIFDLLAQPEIPALSDPEKALQGAIKTFDIKTMRSLKGAA